jgi:hypothetical protein
MKLIPVRTVFITVTPTANVRLDIHAITLPAAPWEEPDRMMLVTAPQPQKRAAKGASDGKGTK